MLRLAAVLALFASTAFAGDSVPSVPVEPAEPEVFVPFIIEEGPSRPLWMTADDWTAAGVTQQMLLDHFAQDDDDNCCVGINPTTVPAVPLPPSLWLLAAAVGGLYLKGKRNAKVN